MSAGIISLMRKDWRLFRLPVLACITLGIGGYLLSRIIYLIDLRRGHNFPFLWDYYLGQAAWFGVFATTVTAAVFGGTAFALERRERWAEFLNLLPPRRAYIAISKLLVAAASLIVALKVHVAVLWSIGEPRGSNWLAYMVMGCAMIMLFGISWMLSVALSSAAVSASVAILLTVGAGFIVSSLGKTYDWQDDGSAIVFAAVSVVSGAACFMAGTIYYLCRVEP
jgi:ABC-type transport system involved in multi-copper enzyme maturation permease subunit